MKLVKKCQCSDLDYKEIELPVRKFLRSIRRKGICTHSSEGGGKDHGAPDFIYVEAHLTKRNLEIARKNRFLLKKLYSASKKPLFDGNAIEYGRKTGFYLVGINKKGLTKAEIKKKLSSLPPLLQKQKKHKVWKPFW